MLQEACGYGVLQIAACCDHAIDPVCKSTQLLISKRRTLRWEEVSKISRYGMKAAPESGPLVFVLPRMTEARK